MNRAFSKVFINEEGVEFGIIRKAKLPFPSELEGAKVLAEDESGNYFIEVDEAVYFWDHETSATEFLASSLDNFISGCAEPEAVELKPDQVKSVWVDPEFAKKFGIKSKP
ncbi:SMI1/KNR4 family protein [Shewanella algae]|uniref:SMI1/KNR4 family protein n=1 Tax=Shewanella algae TaxID=38313 RepID=UPI001AAF0443|nr:SMI1/KNR4 family protein [Shewanella algae]MBO2587859.1 SMI1/KNR4 family protein [Shewanella algae]